MRVEKPPVGASPQVINTYFMISHQENVELQSEINNSLTDFMNKHKTDMIMYKKRKEFIDTLNVLFDNLRNKVFDSFTAKVPIHCFELDTNLFVQALRLSDTLQNKVDKLMFEAIPSPLLSLYAEYFYPMRVLNVYKANAIESKSVDFKLNDFCSRYEKVFILSAGCEEQWYAIYTIKGIEHQIWKLYHELPHYLPEPICEPVARISISN